MWYVFLILELQKKDEKRSTTTRTLKWKYKKNVELQKRICYYSCNWGTWGSDQKPDDVGY